jgi:methylmalonyl-CoA/ethylmalonyl-CoA epimerase
MEIADVFVVNKSDRDGADRMAASIESTLSLETWSSDRWRPPVLRAVATTGEGVPEIVATIARFREQAGAAEGSRRRARAEWRLREILSRRFMIDVEANVLRAGEFDALLDRIAGRDVDVYTAADELLVRATGRARAATSTPTGLRAVLDHVGVATADAAPILALLAGRLGLEVEDPIDVASQKVRVRFVDTGEAKIELVEPTADDSPVAAFLRKRGPGLHHVALRVADLPAELQRLDAAGVRLIDRTPREGAHGRLIAFVHPASAGGVLVELVQATDRGSAS